MPTIQEILKTMDYGPAPESSKEANAWLEQHGRRFGLFIDNAWSEAADTFGSFNPADGSELAQVTQATALDVDRAVAAARRAQPGWASMGGNGRAKILYALARLLQKHSRLFAVLETLDNGKTIRETRDADLPPLLPSRRLGAPAVRRICGLPRGRRGRPDRAVELPAADAGLENRARARRR
jgi:aldehyde dehydrogenase (NAD+)